MLPLILLIDDNEEILDFLSGLLSEKYSTLKSMNGADAIKILENEAVQLIISDVMMPEMDGFELCRHIKSHFETCHIPVILLTAKNTMQSKVEGLETGADAYIEKPFSKEHLMAQIANLLANRNMIREYFASSPLVHIKTMAHSKTDEIFLEQLNKIIYDNLEDVEMDVDKLAKMMTMSRVTLYRKIKAISNLSPNELINITRLKKAAQLLAEGDHKIYEISDMAGFSSHTHFGRNFLKQFGMTPTDYASSKHEKKSSPS